MGTANYAQPWSPLPVYNECVSRLLAWWRLPPLHVWTAVGSLELISPLTGLVSRPVGCPRTLLAQVSQGGGAGLVADNWTTRQVLLVYMVPVADNRVSSDFGIH